MWAAVKGRFGGPTSATPWELSECLSRVGDARREISTTDAHRHTQMNRVETNPPGEVDRDLQRDTPHPRVPVVDFLLPCGNIAFGNGNARGVQQNSRQDHYLLFSQISIIPVRGLDPPRAACHIPPLRRVLNTQSQQVVTAARQVQESDPP
jgi:hypothetical protein